MLNVVALVGRPNVGKSTIFNALTGTRDALVADYEGLTRDRQYGIVENETDRFVLIDTGGMMPQDHELATLTVGQIHAAIEEADLNVMVVDAKDGCMPEDLRIAKELRSTGKPVIIAINKTDGRDEAIAAADFYQLGFDQYLTIAASHRRGIRSLDELIRECLPEPPVIDDDSQETEHGINIAVVGRPNVGKSTLINRLLGEERVLAFDMPGTTRDAISIPWERQGHDEEYILIDTAGVRRRSKVTEAVEKFSIIKALQAIERSDVVIMLLAADEGVVEQDATLLGHILRAGRPMVIAVNKWDGLDTDTRKQTIESLDRRLRFIPFVKRIMISALHGSGLGEMLSAMDQAYTASQLDASTNQLTEILLHAFESHQPPLVRGKTPKLRYAHLGGNHPLRIVIHGSRVDDLPEAYRRYLMNTFRERLKLVGTPIKLDFRSGNNPFEGKKNTLSPRQIAKRKRLVKYIKKNKK